MEGAKYFAAECDGEKFSIAAWTDIVETTCGGFGMFPGVEPSDGYRRFAAAHRVITSNNRPVRVENGRIVFSDTGKQITITGEADPF